MEDEEKTSGIECDLSEVEKTLEEIAEKEAEAEDTVENEKRTADNAKAAEMRNRALESLNTEHRKGNGTKRRRKWNQSKKVVEVEVTQLHICAKKNDLVQKWKEEELHLQNQRVEVEDKREDQSRKQHQDMMKVLVEQTKQQQEQMLSFQQLFTLMQQQKSQIIMKLQEKRN